MEQISLFFLNVLVLAIPPAILEIAIEKDKGWGSGLSRATWYGRIIGERNPIFRLVAKATGVPYFFGYAIFMYFVLIPLILSAEYLLGIADPFFLLAVYFGTLFTEDFLWFVFNPYFHSLRELLKGPDGIIWWHQRWLKIGNNTYLPVSYFSGIFLTIIFLWLSKNLYP